MPLPRALGGLVLALLLGAVTPAQESTEGGTTEPLDEGITEAVEVRLVILDTLVLDRKGRTVPDLTVEDFDLLVDHEPTSIDTFDRICPAGRAEDPRGIEDPADREPPAAPSHPRRIIFAVDYLNLRQIERFELLDHLQEMLRHGEVEGEEIMIVALADNVRVELSFTADREAALDTLKRMQYDISLWRPAFDRLTNKRFFLNVRDLLELLETVPESKAMLLFSNQPGLSAVDRDHDYRAIAAGAIASRTAIYPVHAKGLQAPDRTDPMSVRPGGPPVLARLAVDTGGRFTRNTNDLSLGYARAQRDLACRYAIGFYAGADEETNHITVLRVRGEGLMAHHPASYHFRTDDELRRSKLRAALIEPELFADGSIRAHLFPLRPASGNRWEALLAVEFPLPAFTGPEKELSRDIGFTIKKGPHAVQKLDRRVTVRPGDANSEGRVTAVEQIRIRPGDYTLSAVVSDPESDRPGTDLSSFTLEPIRRRLWLMAGPLLGRPTKDEQIAPLLIQRARSGEPLRALTRICSVGPAEPSEPVVSRSIRERETAERIALPQPELVPERSGKVRCRSLVETFATEALEPGEYLYRVTLTGETGEVTERSLRFSVEAAPSEAP